MSKKTEQSVEHSVVPEITKREIKFRYWDGEKMCETPTIFLGKVWNTREDREENGCVLIQFTGLLDKNGKEIYEGDIVNTGKWIGKYFPCTAVVKYGMVEFTCECINEWAGSNADLNGNAIVIGNIFENPELLTK